MREGEELLSLAARLERGDYFPQPGSVFVTEKPKYREVQAAVYRDRVVHHLIRGLVEPPFEAPAPGQEVAQVNVAVCGPAGGLQVVHRDFHQ